MIREEVSWTRLPESQRLRISPEAAYRWQAQAAKEIRDGDIFERAAGGDFGARIIVTAFVELTFGARRTFGQVPEPGKFERQAGQPPARIIGPYGPTSVVVSVPGDALTEDFKPFNRTHVDFPSMAVDGRVDEPLRAHAFPGCFVFFREIKVDLFSDCSQESTSTGRFVAIDASVVDAAGGLDSFVRLANDCIDAVLSWGLRSEAFTDLTRKSRDYVFARIAPAVQVVGRLFCRRPSGTGQHADLVRHAFTELQVAKWVDYAHFLTVAEKSRMTFKWNFILHHASTARRLPLPLEFDMNRDWRLVFEIEERREAARHRLPNFTRTYCQTVSNYDGVRLLLSDFP